MSVTSEEKLVSKLENKAYREAYVSEHVKTSVPLQIRHLREQHELTQTQLAEHAKTTQTVISRLEDPNYGNLTLNSLLKIASALDIGLLVKFVPFSRLLTEFEDLSPKALSVQSFTEELPMLKVLAVILKNTKPRPRINSVIIKQAAVPVATVVLNIAEVEQWRQIQERLSQHQAVYTFSPQIETPASTTLPIPGGQVVLSDTIRVSSSMLYVRGYRTLHVGFTRQGMISAIPRYEGKLIIQRRQTSFMRMEN